MTVGKKYRDWTWTYNNWSEPALASILDNLVGTQLAYVIGIEVADSGTPHLQGYFYFENPQHFSTVKRILLDKAHIMKSRGNQHQNWVYCTKDGLYLYEGMEPWMEARTSKPKPSKTPNWDAMEARLKIKFSEEKLRPWQRDIVNMVSEEPDDRVINWYHEPHGNVGKSWLLKYIATNCEGVTLVSGKATDIYHAIFTMKVKDIVPKIIMVDVPRAGKKFVSYAAIESLKNGLLFNSKYETGMCNFESPHVIVMSNSPPDLSDFSIDRWNVVDMSTVIGSGIEPPSD